MKPISCFVKVKLAHSECVMSECNVLHYPNQVVKGVAPTIKVLISQLSQTTVLFFRADISSTFLVVCVCVRVFRVGWLIDWI